MKNLLFVIEGTDGSGKQTQTKMLVDRLKNNGKKVVTQSFPNYDSPSSASVKMYLNGEFGSSASSLNAYQASALFATDRLCTTKLLEKDINPEDILIFDRYVESNLIHQACKIQNKSEREKFAKWLFDFEYNTLDLPKPENVFFLNMPPEQSIMLAKSRQELKAGTSKDIHEQDTEYLINAYNTGLEIAKLQGWVIIDCVNKNKQLKTPNEINDEIYLYIKKTLKKNSINEYLKEI